MGWGSCRMFSYSPTWGRLAELSLRIALSGAPMLLYSPDSVETLLMTPQDYALGLVGMGI